VQANGHQVVQGRTKTILRSGSDVRVNSARLHQSRGRRSNRRLWSRALLRPEIGQLTHARAGHRHYSRHIEGQQPALTILHAQIQAKPFAISDAPQDTLVRFRPDRCDVHSPDMALCAWSSNSRAKILSFPKTAILITNGQLETCAAVSLHCACELQLAKTQSQSQTEVSRLPYCEEMQKANKEAAKLPTASPKARDKRRDRFIRSSCRRSLTMQSAKVQPDNLIRQLIVSCAVSAFVHSHFPRQCERRAVSCEKYSAATPPQTPATPSLKRKQSQQKNLPPATPQSAASEPFRSLLS